MLDNHQIMIANLKLTNIASLLSDTSRVEMISALLDGRALTAHELAHGAGITAQTASFHLKKLCEAGVLEVLPQGRHRYFRIASKDISEAIKVLMKIAPSTKFKPAAKKKNAVCFARTCYGHLAGYLGIAIAEVLVDMDIIRPSGETDFIVTKTGENFLAELGVDYVEIKKSRRRFASQCLDWSERRAHIGGSLGFALTNNFKQIEWIKTKEKSRDISVTKKGKAAFGSLFHLDVEKLENRFFLSEE